MKNEEQEKKEDQEKEKEDKEKKKGRSRDEGRSGKSRKRRKVTKEVALGQEAQGPMFLFCLSLGRRHFYCNALTLGYGGLLGNRKLIKLIWFLRFSTLLNPNMTFLIQKNPIPMLLATCSRKNSKISKKLIMWFLRYSTSLNPNMTFLIQKNHIPMLLATCSRKNSKISKKTNNVVS